MTDAKPLGKLARLAVMRLTEEQQANYWLNHANAGVERTENFFRYTYKKHGGSLLMTAAVLITSSIIAANDTINDYQGGALACAVAPVLVYPFCAVEIFLTFIYMYHIYSIYLYQI